MQYFKGTLNFLKVNHESNSEHVLSQCLSTNYNSLSCSQPFREKFVSIKPIKSQERASNDERNIAHQTLRYLQKRQSDFVFFVPAVSTELIE